jgi:uncharacterized protein YyaL (SSP411 family)
MTSHPNAFAHLLGALEWYLLTPVEVAVVGDPDAPATRALRRTVWSRPLPTSVRVAAAPGTGGAHTPLLADRTPPAGADAAAWVCQRFACHLPVTTPDALAGAIDAAVSSR